MARWTTLSPGDNKKYERASFRRDPHSASPTSWRRASGYRGNGRMRMRPGSISAKWPGKSSRPETIYAMVLPAAAGGGGGRRKRMTPQATGRPSRHANSPKSLSKVRGIRLSLMARTRTSRSELPGASLRTQATSWPAARKAVTASPGIFSSGGDACLRQCGRAAADRPFRLAAPRSHRRGRRRYRRE